MTIKTDNTTTNKALLSKTNTKKVSNIIKSFVKSYDKTNSPSGYKIVERNAIARVYVFIKKHYKINSFKKVIPADIKGLKQLLTANQDKIFANQERLFYSPKQFTNTMNDLIYQGTGINNPKIANKKQDINPNTAIELSKTLLVKNNQVLASSLDIAERFSKRHDIVIRAIEDIECSKNFFMANFVVAEYKDAQGKPRKSYQMTKDGFTFLVLGFTGKTAAQFKEAYINAFNEMQAQLPQLKTKTPKAIPHRFHIEGMLIHSEDIAELFNKDHNAILKEIGIIKNIVKNSTKLNIDKIPIKKYHDGYLLSRDAILLLDLGSGFNSVNQKLKIIEKYNTDKIQRSLDISKEVQPIYEDLGNVYQSTIKILNIFNNKKRGFEHDPINDKKQIRLAIKLLLQIINNKHYNDKKTINNQINIVIEMLQIAIDNTDLADKALDLINKIEDPILLINCNTDTIRDQIKSFLSNYMSFTEITGDEAKQLNEMTPDDFLDS